MNFTNEVISLCALLITIILHEYAHGFIALKMGDNTAKSYGRLTLNPFKHIDLLGLICLYIFKFGWAKPVPIDMYKLKKNNTLFFVSIAGIIMNFILAIISSVILVKIQLNEYFYTFWYMMLIYNVSLGVFNLLPIPPLDGYRIIQSFLPIKILIKLQKIEKYSTIILVIICVSGLINKITTPLFYFVLNKILRLVV